MSYAVELKNVGNIDHDQNPYIPLPGTTTYTASVKSLEEAVAGCLQYIEFNELGGGNWTGGKVTDKHGKQVAYISYNGRVWDSNKMSNEIEVNQSIIADILKPRIHYHVTPLTNVERILRVGLTPLIGERSAKIGETEPAIYLFPTEQDCETALMGWLDNEFEEEEQLAILEIQLPYELTTHTSEAEYEVLVKELIPPSHIRLKSIE